MSDQAYQLIAIVIYFSGMIAIGLWANSKTKNLDDYMLGGRNLKPGVAALSAGASDMSGWLLMGLPGAVYLTGMVEAWIAIGLTIGAWLNWKFVAPRLRAYTEVSNNSITIPSFLDNRLKGNTRMLRVVSGVIILVFFTFYVSSGMVAGGVFFMSSFGSSYLLGMLLIAGVTVLYTFFGGFLGASYTDLFQGLLMLLALLMVPVVGLFMVGGPAEMVNSIQNAQPDALSLLAGGTAVGVISALAWGLGYFGQPHIIVRFMALRSPADAKSGRRIGVSWMILTVIGAISTALVGIAYFGNRPDQDPTDPEAVFLDLSQILFHPALAGLVLAAVLAAIMSTVSSQLIVSSSALVEDLYNLAAKKTPSPKAQVWMGRAGVLLVAIIAAALAWEQNATILELVGFAWAGFGSAFGPVVILSLFWRKLTNTGAITAMIVGAVTVFVWQYTPWSDLYEIIPGFFLGMLAAIVGSLATYKRDPEIEAEFDQAVRLANDPHQAPTEAAASSRVESDVAAGRN
ncbi:MULTISPECIES: sodium/proline symporter PutP [Kocuria]|uniref:Sodium/proline symporter n=1 Tax=Kocuria gwangalliensis TaxID=501592 RepID=A0ABP8WE61_9MICC|nr:sodium/proline symporter PutP [Kocuria sp.]MDO5367835.1 sodium/proline symporter PutP [Kocuria sp.]